jgi:hypothetical protein
MTRIIPCPLPEYPDASITLPDRWLGLHAERRDEAIEQLDKVAKYKGGVLRNFAVSLALLDDWSLPGLSGKPDKWDFKQIDLDLIAWVNETVLSSFGLCFVVPKALPAESPPG